MSLITFDDGVVRLDNDELPGILKMLSVRGQLKYDETKLDGTSGTARIPAGWEDADIAVTMDLLTDETGSDCYQKLQALHAIYRGADSSQTTEHGQTVLRPPKEYTVVNRHINARGVRKVTFSGLASSETDDDDTIQVVLTFTEANNPAAKAEAQAQGASTQTVVADKSNSITQDDESVVGTI